MPARFMGEQWAARRGGAAPVRVTRQDGSVASARVVNLSALGVFLATPVHFPAASTVSRHLAATGLARRRRRRGKPGIYAGPVTTSTTPNALLAMDFQGGWRLGNGDWCTPFTASDDWSRYLLRCTAARRTDESLVRQDLTAAFEAYGLPDAIRSDNGPPFASAAPGGVSRLAVWLITLGIRPERITPGRPTENGRHERVHRTLEEETASPRVRTRLAQQRVFDGFRQDYNEVRPHEALGQVPPATHYHPSARRWPQALRHPVYPDALEVARSPRRLARLLRAARARGADPSGTLPSPATASHHVTHVPSRTKGKSRAGRVA